MASGGGGFIDISVQFAGQRELVASFAAAGMATRDLSPAWEQVGLLLQRDWEYQFAAEGGYLGAQVGPKWAPLAAATVRDRERKGYPGAHPILVRTGGMEASVVRRGAAGNVFDVRPDHVTVGTANPIAPYHQMGTRKMPARKMIGLAWTARSEIIRVIGDYVRGQVAAAFGR